MKITKEALMKLGQPEQKRNSAQPAKQNNKNIGIRGRLFLGFFSLIIPLLIMIIIFLVKIEKIENFTTDLVHVVVPTQALSITLDTNIYETQIAAYEWLLTGNAAAKSDYAVTWNKIMKTQDQLNDLASQWSNKEYTKRWEGLTALYSPLQSIENKLLAMPNTDNAAKQLIEAEQKPTIDKMITFIDGAKTATGIREGGMFDIQIAELKKDAQTILNDVSDLRTVVFAALIVILLLAIAVSLLTAKIILTPLHRAIDIAKQIASGDRNIDIVITSKDETGELLTALSIMRDAIEENEENLQKSETETRQLFDNIVQTAKSYSLHSSRVAAGDLTQRIHVDNDNVMAQLGGDLNRMTESLASINKQIAKSCYNMGITLEEVKHAVDMQSAGASQQASSINQITASLEEIEKSSTQTIEKAKALGEAAERTQEKGELGLNAVEQSINGMNAVREKVQIIAQTILDLSSQTQQVGEITAVVNNLAQQLKMLALNASIEAAKAGEAGKGFSVVALEVKNLAEQSEQSTMQVQKILEDIRHATEKAVMATEEGIKGVDHGTGLVEQTGGIVRGLSDVINETSIATKQIQAAVRQESIGIEQITAGMNEINQVTASFVQSVKQTTQAMDHLATIAEGLKVHTETYKLELSE